VTGRWFSPDTPVSFTNKTDRHDITEIVLKVALNTLTITIHIIAESDQDKLEDTKGVIESRKSKKKKHRQSSGRKKKDKRKTIVYKTLYSKPKIEQHEPY